MCVPRLSGACGKGAEKLELELPYAGIIRVRFKGFISAPQYEWVDYGAPLAFVFSNRLN